MIASLPYSLWKYHELKDESGEITGYRILKDSTLAFLTGGLIIFISYMFDFWILSLFTRTTFPAPNDLISGYCSSNIFSEVFYSKPRLFVFIWGILGFFYGGAFSFLCLNICELFNQAIISYVLLLIIFFEVVMTSKINII